jgi:hypothetical protein
MEQQEPIMDAEALFVACVRHHLEEHFAPVIAGIAQLVTDLREQVEIREQLAREAILENRALRVEVAKLAANIDAMRNGTPIDTGQVN